MSEELFDLPATEQEIHMLATAMLAGCSDLDLEHLREIRSGNPTAEQRRLLEALCAGNSRKARVCLLAPTRYLADADYVVDTLLRDVASTSTGAEADKIATALNSGTSRSSLHWFADPVHPETD